MSSSCSIERFQNQDERVSCLSAKYAISDIQDNELLTWYLPGWGEKKEDCGEFLHALSCPDWGQKLITGVAHSRLITLKHCFLPECPICYEDWAIREGNTAGERFKEAEQLYFDSGRDLQEARHITLSPPPALHKDIEQLIKTKNGYKKLKKEALKIAKKLGIVGGAIIFHPWRQNHVTHEWYFSPHFHIVGYGYLEKSSTFETKTGWVYKNMGKRSTISGTIIYTLTHCGLAYNNEKRVFHALTWFGLLSYNKVVIDTKTVTEEPIECKACNEYLHEYELKLDLSGHALLPDWSEDFGVFLHKVTRKTYKLRSQKQVPAKIKEIEQRRLSL